VQPQPPEAELLTVAVMQALVGYTSEARWLRYARTGLRHLFPFLPRQSRSRWPTPEGVTVRVLQRLLALTAAIWHNHSTGQPVMRSLIAYDHYC
jgi:hypothetical protein